MSKVSVPFKNFNLIKNESLLEGFNPIQRNVVLIRQASLLDHFAFFGTPPTTKNLCENLKALINFFSIQLLILNNTTGSTQIR